MVSPVGQEEREWEDLIAGMGDEVEPDTYMKPGELLSSPDTARQDGFAQRVNSLEYKGYVRVWDTRTGIESLQPRWLLWQTMQKTREDGTRVFTTQNPHIPQEHGSDLKCPLHPDSPDHDRLVGMGFRPCKKQHIPHQDGLMRHIRKSHVRMWEVLEEEKRQRERDEDRALQRETLQVMTGLAQRGAVAEYVPNTPEAPERPYAAICEQCSKEFRGVSQRAANAAVRMHKRHCKNS